MWLTLACNALSTSPTITPPPTTIGQPNTPTVTPIAPTPIPTATPTPTPAPPTIAPPRPTPTLPPLATATPANAVAPQVISFTARPTITLRVGEVITFTWQAVGAQAALCPIFGSGPLEDKCVEVALTGTRAITISEEALAYTGYGLRISGGARPLWSTVSLNLQCQGLRPWFMPNPPLRCPEAPPLTSSAAAQRFQHGLMIWLQTTDTFYVFYENRTETRQTFEIFSPVRLKSGASPNNRVKDKPPTQAYPLLYEPVSGFGLLWRDEVEGANNIRQRLGWAIEKEFAFEAAYQCEVRSHPRGWTCFLRAPDGKTLRLYPDSTAQARFVWETYGGR